MHEAKRCDASYILQIISASRPSRDWLVLNEFPLDAGKRSRGTPRVDVLAIKVGNGGGYGSPLTREAFEIKVSRRDFLEELRRPAKRRKAYAICDHYYFAVPKGLVGPDEVSSECGLYWISQELACPIVMKSAKDLNPEAPSPLFMMDVARRAYQVGRRHGAESCAFERFDMLSDLAHMLIQNKATGEQRQAAVRSFSRVLTQMQRHTEAKELSRVADGYEPSWGWSVPRTLGSG